MQQQRKEDRVPMLFLWQGSVGQSINWIVLADSIFRGKQGPCSIKWPFIFQNLHLEEYTVKSFTLKNSKFRKHLKDY
jgi:hypothetical protein